MPSKQEPPRRGIGLKANLPPTEIPGSPTTVILPLTRIRVDDAIQPREQTDPAVVDDYAESIRDWIHSAPPIVYGRDAQYWLADGFHRVAAAQRAGLDAVPVVIKPGDRRDALLFAAGANATHGLRRTNADKRRAVETLLLDPEGEWSQWGDRRIADHVGVSHTFVANRRRQLATVASCDTLEPIGAETDGQPLLSDGSHDPGAADVPPSDIAQRQALSPSSLPGGLSDVTPHDSELNPAPECSARPIPQKRVGKDGKTRSLPRPSTSTRTDLDGLAKRLDTLAKHYGDEPVVRVLRSWIETQERRP